MTDELSIRIRPMKLGLAFALLALLYGLGLGAGFGVWEDDIKGHLKAEAQAVKNTVYKGNEAKTREDQAKVDAAMKKITDKSWVYFKRAHMHAAGLGAAVMAVCLMLAFLNTCNVLKLLAGASLGIGSLVYSFCWMLAGLRAPGLGSTGLAKESLHWIGIPAVGLCVIGLILATLGFCHGMMCCCRCSNTPDNE